MVQVLNDIIAHAGLEGAAPFTEELIASEEGFKNRLGEGVPDELEPLLPEMRALFERPSAVLARLIAEFWPDLGFSELEDEV